MISIPYGDSSLDLDIPSERARVVDLPGGGRVHPPLGRLRRALDEPIGAPPLEELAAGRRVVCLLDDATRAEPHEAFIRAVLERLTGARFVRGIIATGSHERFSAGNRHIMEQFRQAAAALGIRHEILVHDCEDAAAHERLTVTARGTPVEVDRAALDADLLVVTSDVKNHYFAGYSNPLKGILPGVSAFATIERNHSLALEPLATFGRHPWHPDPDRRANPVAEDMLEGVRAVTREKQTFVLAAVTAPDGAVWAGAGDMEAVTREAIGLVDRTESVQVEPARYLIVSPGGHPEDETLYNAQRGLELSRNAVREGGEVLFVARCEKGAAPTAKAREEFYDRLTAPLDQVLAGLKERYVLYSHKAYKFAQLILSVGGIWMVTDMPEEHVTAAHLHRAERPQDVIDRWLGESNEPILVNAYANKMALYAPGGVVGARAGSGAV